ncbi:lysine transporter LysE [Chromobacterium haemolyticum]|uniref:LysE family translocator n=1 Tax=Chromobacterium haemolyticum TaxID=394935 RepID=UPI0009DA2770|nr:LysE family translocator [Chromobacterium haemolyticum]OQS36763.1 lysine transporter LysE [Chromobacterium haemolyticum]
MNQTLAMASFALAASITPGPVNLVALSCGARYGARAGMRHVGGATAGFTLLLLLTGLGLEQTLRQWPALTQALQWTGVTFLLYMAYQLARSDGSLDMDKNSARPSWWRGAAIQWLNPKAWIAALAGCAAFTSGQDAMALWRFAGLYFLICYVSVGAWVVTGAWLGQKLESPKRLRLFNQTMALLLGLSALGLLN